MGNQSNYSNFQNPPPAYNQSNSSNEDYSDSQKPASPYTDDYFSSVQNYSGSQNPPSAYLNNTPSAAANLLVNWGNGVNLQPSYSNGGDVDLGWSLMKKHPKIRTVRLMVDVTPEGVQNISFVERWIKEAVDNSYQVIVAYNNWSKLGSNEAVDLLDAANWWQTNYQNLSGAGSFVINLVNEWGNHDISSDDYADAYNQAIEIVRRVYKDNPIIIDR